MKNQITETRETAETVESPHCGHAVTKVLLPDGCMQEFQEQAASFFEEYSNQTVGYLITTPEKLAAIAPYTNAAAAACVVVRDEAAFDKCASIWQAPQIWNSPSLDLTRCLTFITFDRPQGETVTEDIICIPSQFLDPAIDDSMDTGHLVVILCSLSRAMLFVFPFDDGDMGCLQASCLQTGVNWRPYRVYDEQTMEDAASKYGHLHKGSSKGWGMEITSVFTEEEAGLHHEQQH